MNNDKDYHCTIAGSLTTSVLMMMNFGECLKDLQEDYESRKSGRSLKKGKLQALKLYLQNIMNDCFEAYGSSSKILRAHMLHDN